MLLRSSCDRRLVEISCHVDESLAGRFRCVYLGCYPCAFLILLTQIFQFLGFHSSAKPVLAWEDGVLLLSLSLPPPYSFFLSFVIGSDLSSPWFVRKARNQLSRSAWVLLFLFLLLLFSTVICMFEFFFNLDQFSFRVILLGLQVQLNVDWGSEFNS